MDIENKTNNEETLQVITNNLSNNNNNTNGSIMETQNNNTNVTTEEKVDFKPLLTDEAMNAIGKFGYVDEEGNVWLKKNESGEARKIGKIKSDSDINWYKAYLQRFEDFQKKYEKLKEDFNKTENKNIIISKIESMIEGSKSLSAIGDFDPIIKDLKEMAKIANEKLVENLAKKEQLCVKAEEISLSNDFKKAAADLKALQQEWKSVGAVPKDKQDEILKRFNAAIDKFYERQRNYYDEQEIVRWENLKLKEKLVEKAEQLSTSTDWKKTSEELKKLQEEWKTIGPVPKDKSDDIWKKFRQALDTFYERQKAHFNQMDSSKQENLEKKELLCQKAELLSDSTDWKETSAELEKLQKEWKTIGPVPPEKSDEVWKRFRTALDKFYNNMRAHYSNLDKERQENLKKKEELCKRAEALCNSNEWDITAEELKRLQQEWKLIGPVPKKQSDAIWARFRKAMDTFFERRRAFIDSKKQESEVRKADFKNRLADTIKRKQGQIERIKQEIKEAEEEIEKIHEKLNIIVDDENSQIIKKSFLDKEDELKKVIEKKKNRITELEKDITDIQAKLS
ncbi:MAG TPA: DUF349 domain-containing protein [Bacteroidota bacterium]|nr:DUF349 domain-containing protein [Bacteroidota bacterium]